MTQSITKKYSQLSQHYNKNNLTQKEVLLYYQTHCYENFIET